jgi:ABC-type bacteriocin/lantibiotic exporters, contain an N-terminal double-glycine peptidase domain
LVHCVPASPCIGIWDLSHFVVLAKLGKRERGTILDPAVGERK